MCAKHSVVDYVISKVLYLYIPYCLKVLDTDYSTFVWPSAIVLAQYIWHFRHRLPEKHILELGAGTALPGVVASSCGAAVTLSDNADLPRCLDNCRRSCQANGITDVRVLGLTWGDVSPDLILLPAVDIILGSDVFYEPKDFEKVFSTVVYLLQKSPRAEFWTTYQVRSLNWTIEPLLLKWKLQCREVPCSSFGATFPEFAGITISSTCTIRMFVITMKEKQHV
uniref:histone-arginine methyltransferase METTL23 isoform X4 n=1 Tax=Myxine glutinosa TaxID=7769 RepID=UPI00358E1764